MYDISFIMFYKLFPQHQLIYLPVLPVAHRRTSTTFPNSMGNENRHIHSLKRNIDTKCHNNFKKLLIPINTLSYIDIYKGSFITESFNWLCNLSSLTKLSLCITEDIGDELFDILIKCVKLTHFYLKVEPHIRRDSKLTSEGLSKFINVDRKIKFIHFHIVATQLVGDINNAIELLLHNNFNY